MFIVQTEEDLEELASINIEKMDQELNVLQENLDRQQPDLKAIDEYNRKENVYLERVAELEEVTAKKEAQRLEKPFHEVPRVFTNTVIFWTGSNTMTYARCA